MKITRLMLIPASAAFFAAAPLLVAAAGTQLQNPLSVESLQAFIEGALKALVMVALPIVSLFIVYAGFKYVMARGNPGKIGEAHQNFLYVIIGTVLILGAWVLATLIGGTVSQLVR